MGKYILVLLVLCGCAKHGDESKKTISNLPSWYISPTQSDSSNLYGAGEGYTIQEASRSALNNLSSKLVVSISSDASTLLEENKHSFNEQSRQKINERVQEVTFSNYKVSNSSQRGMRFFAEVKVDRANFIEEQRSILDQDHKVMNNLYKSSASSNILIRRNKLAEIKRIMVRSVLVNQTLYGLRVNREFKKNLDKYQFYQDSYDKILEKIEFIIQSDDKGVKDIIIEALNDNNLKVINRKVAYGKNQVVVNIRTSLDVKNIYGSDITKIKLKFKLFAHDGKILASNIYGVSGASSGKVNSFNEALKKLSIKIKKEGILRVIGADKK